MKKRRSRVSKVRASKKRVVETGAYEIDIKAIDKKKTTSNKLTEIPTSIRFLKADLTRVLVLTMLALALELLLYLKLK